MITLTLTDEQARELLSMLHVACFAPPVAFGRREPGDLLAEVLRQVHAQQRAVGREPEPRR